MNFVCETISYKFYFCNPQSVADKMVAQKEYLSYIVHRPSREINHSYPVLWMVEDVQSSFSRFSHKLALNQLQFVCNLMPTTEEKRLEALHELAEKCNSEGKFRNKFYHFIFFVFRFAYRPPWNYPKNIH